MKAKDILQIYSASPFVNMLNTYLEEPDARVQLKGLHGSADAVVIASSIAKTRANHLLVVHDREEATYLQNDLENLLEQTVTVFPASYKRPYHFEEVDNANVLQRAEVLKQFSEEKKGVIVVTYPDALSEKVINKKSLVKNTFGVKVKDKIDTEFIAELLIEYGFEKTDFVYEAGNFAIRGGIIDIYSYANDLPYRIELFGKEVESIRTFDPETQLSEEKKEAISIIPDIQTKLLQESRESFLEYIPENTIVWMNDVAFVNEVIQKCFDKIVEDIDVVREASSEPDFITKPEQLFDDKATFQALLKKKKVVEFGAKSYFRNADKVAFDVSSQPNFNKNFQLLTDDLHQFQTKGYRTIICSDSTRHLDKINTILEEHDASLSIQEFPIPLRGGFIDHEEKLAIYTDHQIFERYFKYKSKKKHSKSQALTLKELKNLNPGDFVTHIDYGIGRFAGMVRKEVNGNIQESIRLIYRDDDVLYISVHSLHKIAKYSGKEGTAPLVSKLGSPEWEKKKSKVKKRVKEIAIDLIKLYAERKTNPGFAFSKDTYMQAELETSFIYEDTPDQAKATEAVKEDMEKPHPMDRLVCGDVGFGKTEVAIRSAFKAVADSKQVAILVPTTILAMQHYKTFVGRLGNLPCRVEYINRFRTTKEVKEILADLKVGKVDILIGTHKIVGKSVEFKDLGLLIIDEEQKFGVAVKEKLKEMRSGVDVLTLTATPIPRTLQFSLMGARDFSVIATPPPNRQGVTTEIHSWNEELIRDAITYELDRGGQVFFVHNRIGDIEELGNIIMRLVPDCKVGVAHGQMEGKKLEKAMMQFVNHEFDVLVSTNIIESGLDIPNANTIIINRAFMYGLSDLHQMRGRVGRSNKKAFCYMFVPSMGSLTADARKRLLALEEFSELGDGFKIAMRDLDIRGAGDLLGGEQTGFINDLGFETYQKLLDEAIKEVKQSDFKALFNKDNNAKVFLPIQDCVIETDLEVVIPDDYVSNITERLRLYNQLDNTKDEKELTEFITALIDRFGALPQSVTDLTEMVRLRWLAEQLGFEKIKLTGGTLKGYIKIDKNDDYFQSDIFGRVLAYIQLNAQTASFKEHRGKMILTFKRLPTIEKALEVLSKV